MESHIAIVRDYFVDFQSEIVNTLEQLDGGATFSLERIETPSGGFSQPRVLADGKVLEKAAVQFTYSRGTRLPPAASATRPHLSGKSFEATAISVIVHPWNPNIPTTHLNLRMFVVDTSPKVWYFGGGFDLTPYLPHEEDFLAWHRYARQACATDEQYKALKKQCDDYFFLPHRNECRGIGGLFFDDYDNGGFEESFQFVAEVGKNFLAGYSSIVEKRRNTTWSSEDEDWMLVRRGRYAEFNLAIDRGTKYGLQSGRRIESVLASLPPRAKWTYRYGTPKNSPYESLMSYLQPGINWLNRVDNSVNIDNS